jgi:hypothetical protein
MKLGLSSFFRRPATVKCVKDIYTFTGPRFHLNYKQSDLCFLFSKEIEYLYYKVQTTLVKEENIIKHLR